MRVRSTPGSSLHGEVAVPGDKSIAHRWLILAATGLGSSRLVDLPGSLDVRSTASCLGAITGQARPALEAWARNDPSPAEGHGSTWNAGGEPAVGATLEVEGEGRAGLLAPSRALDCGNAGTAMRLLAGAVASAPFDSVLTGDESLSSRPMERVAEPLRRMGAMVRTVDGHAPLSVTGGRLHGITYRTPVPSGQIKGAVLLAGLAAEGDTTVTEAAPTRDHTERAFAALGVPVEVEGTTVRVSPSQHEGFAARCPGDPSSAAFLIAAAALTGSELSITGVGLNPSRTRFLAVMHRMGIPIDWNVEREELGEPVGSLHVRPAGSLEAVRIGAEETPLVIDEIPVLALLAAHAHDDTRFQGLNELRLKESDRLSGIAGGIRGMGGQASVEGDDLVIAGAGLMGGRASSNDDHRMAMAFAVGALAAAGPCEIDGMESVEVSFPGFLPLLQRLGARLEVTDG